MKNKSLLIAILFTFSISAHSAVVTFESGLDPLFIYDVIGTTSTATATSGYESMRNFTGSLTYARNPFAASPSTFTWAGSGTFNLDSFALAGAWGTQTLLIEGLFNGVVTFTDSVSVSTTAGIYAPGWTGIDAFRITIGSDFIQTVDPGIGSGQHWVVDNITVNAVPIPAAVWLLGSGLLGFFGISRRKRALPAG